MYSGLSKIFYFSIVGKVAKRVEVVAVIYLCKFSAATLVSWL